MQKSIVITGVGILSSNAKGYEEFCEALRQGVSGAGDITTFDPAEFRVQVAGEVKDFDAKEYMGKKGLRTLDRSTRLLVSSSKLAIADSGLEITDDNSVRHGVSVGTTLGSIKSIAEFDEVTLREGPRYVNPALFPNTVINSPGSQVAIWNNIRGFSNTLSNGFTTSIDAVDYACSHIESGLVDVVLTGGVEEMCMHTFLGFHALKYLSGSRDGESFVNCPFDRRRNGVLLGEGACLMPLESEEYARKRKAKIRARVLGYGYEFTPFRLNRFHPKGIGMVAAMQKAMDDAGVTIDDIDCIFANANSTQGADKIETLAIKEVFGSKAKTVPVTAVKSLMGECYSVSGAFAMAAAVASIEKGIIPPTINYQEKDPDCDLNIVANTALKKDLKTVLINNFSPSGGNACLVIQKYA